MALPGVKGLIIVLYLECQKGMRTVAERAETAETVHGCAKTRNFGHSTSLQQIRNKATLDIFFLGH